MELLLELAASGMHLTNLKVSSLTEGLDRSGKRRETDDRCPKCY